MQLIQEHDTHRVWSLHDGKHLALTPWPESVAAQRPRDIIKKAYDAVDRLDTARASVSADVTLSDQGKAERLKPVAQEAAETLANARADLAAFSTVCDELRAKVYGAPPLAPTDAVAALQDMEIRQIVRDTPTGERGDLLQAMAAQPRFIEAVLRSPVTIPAFSDLAERVWAEHVEKTSSDVPKVAEFAQARAWASDTLSALEAAAAVPQRKGATA